MTAPRHGRLHAPRAKESLMQPYTLSVPDMSCGHCRASIEAALAPMNAALSFDMAAGGRRREAELAAQHESGGQFIGQSG